MARWCERISWISIEPWIHNNTDQHFASSCTTLYMVVWSGRVLIVPDGCEGGPESFDNVILEIGLQVGVHG